MNALPMEGTKEQYRPEIRFTIDGKLRCLTRDEWLASEPEHFIWVD